MTVGGYESMKFRLSPRHARLSNHGGHEYVSSLIDKNLNIMSRLETQITNDEDKRKKTQAKENTFGLGAKYIATRKQSVQPLPSASMISGRALSPIA